MKVSVHVVGNVDVGRSPAELPGVRGQHEDVEPGLPSPVDKGKCDLVVVTHVQLKESRTLRAPTIWALIYIVRHNER